MGVLSITRPNTHKQQVRPATFIVAVIVLIAAALFVSGVKVARADSMKIETGFASGYELVDPHVRLSDEAVAQGSFFYLSDRGFYAGIWASNNLDSFDSNFGDNSGAELDLIVGWAGEISHGVIVDIQAAEWLMPGSNNDFTVLHGKASRKFTFDTNHSIEPYVGLEGQWTDSDSIAIGHVGAIHRYTFDEVTLVNEARLNQFDGGMTTFVYLASVEIPLEKNVTLIPFYRSSYYFGSGDCVSFRCGPTVCDESDWNSVGGIKVALALN